MNKAELWNKISRIGLRDEEDVMQFREVILLNRILVVMMGVMCFYIPVEVYLNGSGLVHLVVLMMVLLTLTLVFHYFRFFRFARYYVYLTGTIFVTCMGLVVGKGAGNYVSLIPVVLLIVILFKTTIEKVLCFLLTVSLYLIQNYLFGVIQPQVQLTETNQAFFSVVFFLLAMILTFIAGFYLMRTNGEYETIIIDHKEKMELKNKEITDSINYAKRIQAAILPTDSVFRTHLPDSFVLYKPKDIVAGDFYWLEKKNDLVIFAAADCTGHGVPGAMVSVICNNALNRSVREFDLTDPAKILDKTREIIISEFEKSDDEVKDGMDISLCCYNPETKQLVWAGANNPLWIINEKGLTEYKANKQPIGKFYDPKPYTSHTLQLKKNDLIFIFTDGYQDQFGGPKGKKFKASSLKNLILSLRDKQTAEQKVIIDNTFESWKGNLEQIDDVCIIGVKIH
ncbi:MAG: protein serine/threonine phosphatase [Bacteroidetes bacterium]|jgi:serine phosphatase RsbU (regulator of sigma subunit)|nr:protein serine/threonine phosphatase [Bacteroidota bacterium]